MFVDSGTTGIEGGGLICVLNLVLRLNFNFFELNRSDFLLEFGLVMMVDGFRDDLIISTFTDS